MTEKLKASGIHFLLSAVVVVTAMLVVFFVWYPYPYSHTNDIWTIVLILIAVDVVLGPTLTFVVFNSKKSKTSLQRDLGMIATVQVAALCYGLHTVYIERPVFVVFAVDRYDVVTASEVDASKATPSAMENKSVFGPHLVYALPGQTPKDKEKLLFDALDGKPDIERRPARYRAYPHEPHKIVERGVDLDSVLQLPANAGKERATKEQLKRLVATDRAVIYLPLNGKISPMIMVVDEKTAEPIGALDLYPFGPSASRTQQKVADQDNSATPQEPTAISE